MLLIDSHCHIDAEEFEADRTLVLARAHAAGVTRLVVPAISASLWPRLLNLCSTVDGLYPALGLHPVFQHIHTQADLHSLEKLLQQHRPVAIGEIGLDFYIPQADHTKQIEYFDAQLELAIKHDLPVILHVRKAHDEILHSLKHHRVKGGICHAFNGSMQQAQQYLDLGFKLGFGGMLTYERSNKLRKLAAELPLHALVLETDAPDMTVASHHGQRNSPEYLPECLQALASIRKLTLHQVADACTLNTLHILNLDAYDRDHRIHHPG